MSLSDLDAFLSFCSEDISFAKQLAKQLEARGLRIFPRFFDEIEVSLQKQKAVLTQSRTLLLLVGVSGPTEHQLEHLQYAAESDPGMRIIQVVLPGASVLDAQKKPAV